MPMATQHLKEAFHLFYEYKMNEPCGYFCHTCASFQSRFDSAHSCLFMTGDVTSYNNCNSLCFHHKQGRLDFQKWNKLSYKRCGNMSSKGANNSG